MSDPVTIIRAIVRDELKSLRLGDIGVVTSVFPHAEGDVNNYECNVRLREAELELRKVPMCTPHIGMASVPRVNDLVLISYVGADPNRPIVVGRLYSDQANPPEHKEDEWRLESPLQGETSLALDAEGSIVLTAGETLVTIKKSDSIELTAGKTSIVLKQDHSIEITGESDLKVELKGNAQIEAKGNLEVKCSDCKIDASGNVELGSGGAGVITEQSHKCYFTGAPLVGSKTVKAKG